MADELRNMRSKAPKLQVKREMQRFILKMNDDFELQLQQNWILPQQPINDEYTMDQARVQIPIINYVLEVPNNVLMQKI